LASASVIVFAMLEIDKANVLSLEVYLNHLPTVLPECFASNPQLAVDDLHFELRKYWNRLGSLT